MLGTPLQVGIVRYGSRTVPQQIQGVHSVADGGEGTGGRDRGHVD